jgi:acyl transferase domain-containing protein
VARETISFFTDQELAASGLDVPALKQGGSYVPARGVLKDADCFDAAFFGIHQKEAEPNSECFSRGAGRHLSGRDTLRAR